MSMSFFSHSEESTCFLNMYIMDEKIDDNCILTGAVEAWTPVPQEYKSDALLKNIRTPNFFRKFDIFDLMRGVQQVFLTGLWGNKSTCLEIGV